MCWRWPGAGGRVVLAGRPLGTFVAGDLHGLCFLGFVGMIDPLRPEAKAAIAACQAAGVQVAMVLFRLSPLRNPLLLLGTGTATLLHITAMYLPGLRDVLHLQPVSLSRTLLLGVLALSLFAVTELHKAWLRARTRAQAGPGSAGPTPAADTSRRRDPPPRLAP